MREREREWKREREGGIERQEEWREAVYNISTVSVGTLKRKPESSVKHTHAAHTTKL